MPGDDQPNHPNTLVVPGDHQLKFNVPESNRASNNLSTNAWNNDGDDGRRLSGCPPGTTNRVSTFAGKGGGNHRKTYGAVLVHSSWYHSKSANGLRNCLNSKTFTSVMMVALFTALFLPDIWVIAGVNDDVVIDVLLTGVMSLFTFELVALSVTDAKYFLSFFFWMDILGTVFMIFDITFFLGSSNTEVKMLSATNSGSNPQEQFMLLRATRATKLGARAGRLSKLLRMLRFLPFLAGGHKHGDERPADIASVISGQLALVLANRVACLTIILVILYPFFEMYMQTAHDYGLASWSDRCSTNMLQDRSADVAVELQMMSSYYADRARGPWPYKACTGRLLEEDGKETWLCAREWTGWNEVQPPPRMASATWVYTESFMIGFNMYEEDRLTHGLEMLKMMFIIFIMVFSGMALSSVVTELAVRPLERMLDTVRTIAKTVFKFHQEVEADENVDDVTDIDSSSEMKLLEKVVQKLAVIADLAAAKEAVATEDMGEEDIGVLNMMQGKNVVQEADKARRSVAVPRRHALTPNIRLEDFGVSHDLYMSFAFNAITLSKAQRTSIAIFTISRFHGQGEGFVSTQDEEAMLHRFIAATEKEYLPNPFHNFQHALDVSHGVARMMRLMSTEAYFSDLEQFSLLIAAIAHDLGHPGVNNGFLSEVGHELALQYNDRSPLENMHCAKLYQLLANPEANIFVKLSKDQYKESRKNIIEAILHTDLVTHGNMVKDLQMTFQVNTEVFNVKHDQSAIEPCSMAELEVFNQAPTKVLVMDTILHSADVSNPCRSWDVTQAWARHMLEEFFAQGDQEKMLGIPVQALNDRDKLNMPNSQMVFVEFMIAPFFAAQIRLWPRLKEYGEHLAENIQLWEDMWVKDASPSDEERSKVRARVDKVKTSMEDAITRNHV